MNPADWAVQAKGDVIFPFLKYPLIQGEDVAGEIVEIGSSVTRFKVGDRVLGYAGGMLAMDFPRCAYQHYVVLREDISAPIPHGISYEQACVIPLGLATAAGALYHEDYLALQLPTVPPPKPTGKVLLVWGGSSSVGCNAIQLARSSGYDVITTCATRNFDLVKRIGAFAAFDYNLPNVADELQNALQGRELVGAIYCVNAGADKPAGPPPVVFDKLAEVLVKTSGRKFVASAGFVPKPLPEGIEAKFVLVPVQKLPLGPKIFAEFLGKALDSRQFVPAPDPHVVGTGLDHIQAALDLMGKGISGAKVVVSL